MFPYIYLVLCAGSIAELQTLLSGRTSYIVLLPLLLIIYLGFGSMNSIVGIVSVVVVVQVVRIVGSMVNLIVSIVYMDVFSIMCRIHCRVLHRRCSVVHCVASIIIDIYLGFGSMNSIVGIVSIY